MMLSLAIYVGSNFFDTVPMIFCNWMKLHFVSVQTVRIKDSALSPFILYATNLWQIFVFYFILFLLL